ncbi:hypothetical protein Lfu02_03150 [Longispora fulva]|nr:hypothetical protein Lfu02_03150 [Longispora fulva]
MTPDAPSRHSPDPIEIGPVAVAAAATSDPVTEPASADVSNVRLTGTARALTARRSPRLMFCLRMGIPFVWAASTEVRGADGASAEGMILAVEQCPRRLRAGPAARAETTDRSATVPEAVEINRLPSL